MNNREPVHTPVLLHEVLSGLNLSPNKNCIDGTVGLGGHAREILKHTAPNGKLIGFDRDQSSLLLAMQNLKEFTNRFIPIHDSYAHVEQHADSIQKVQPIHAILLDLGLSSVQLDLAYRGFSFRFSGPLDMRFDQSRGTTAADILNGTSEEQLVRIFKEYGEEPHAKKIARAIVERRIEQPFHETADLVDVIERSVPIRALHMRIHPATRVFQALRIAVNHELEHLSQFLPHALQHLAPGGRFAVISFHSLEDRIVKRFFKNESTECLCPPEIPECRCNHHASIRRITKKPITATEEEIAQNPRARSAKLRIIEKR